jgi:hypothetical protein
LSMNFNDFLWSDVHYFLKTFTASAAAWALVLSVELHI